ncbi:HD-GYP domain-containing protein [Niallia sp. Krafla_26]|uniref:HD-GYP domain-containing protein n=1 Tax=Niallia sp. Krafla_26 TaxID=3064703 RepID=UPI003D169FBB
MRIKTTELREGSILSEDIYSKTSRPILKKNTVLTNELIEVIKLFLLPTVEVNPTLITGAPIQSTMEKGRNHLNEFPQEFETKEFTTLFLEATKEFKRHFQLWQSGLPINITKLRSILLPLLEETFDRPSEIFYLHHLSTKGEYLYQHSLAVGLLCGFMAKQLKYSQGDTLQAALAGLLADCGMSKVRPGILQKRAALTAQEFKEIKNHTKYSYLLVQNITSLTEGAKVAIFQHHERLDGSGYPMGLAGNKIHDVAKIIAVADTYHAMTSQRTYRKKQSPFKVLELMRQDQFGKFDVQALGALCSGIINFSKGSQIKLSNGQLGEVLFISDKTPTRPLIKLYETDEIINLENYRELYIDEII